MAWSDQRDSNACRVIHTVCYIAKCIQKGTNGLIEDPKKWFFFDRK